MSSLATLRRFLVGSVAVLVLSGCGKDSGRDTTVVQAAEQKAQVEILSPAIGGKKNSVPVKAKTLPHPESEPSHGGKSLTEWIKELDSANAKEREKAVSSIRAMHFAKKDVGPALPSLTLRLKDESPGLRHSTAVLLINIRGQEAQEAVTYLTETANDAKSPYSRPAALALKSLLGISGPSREKVLIGQLQDPDAFTRRRALEELTALVRRNPAAISEQVITALVGTLKDDKDAQVRVRAAAALGALKTADVVGPLVAVLEDNDLSVSAGAAHALGEIGLPAKTSATALVNVLKTYGKNGPGDAAARALERFGATAAVAILPLLGHQKEDLRREGMRILFRLGDEAKKASKEITQALHDPDVFVCITAAGALVEIQGRDAKEAFTVLDQAFKVHALRPGYAISPSKVAANTVTQMSKNARAVMFPVLMDSLRNGTIRDRATTSVQAAVLRDIAGPEFKSFVPALLELVQIQSLPTPTIRETIRKIDPSAALKAGIR